MNSQRSVRRKLHDLYFFLACLSSLPRCTFENQIILVNNRTTFLQSTLLWVTDKCISLGLILAPAVSEIWSFEVGICEFIHPPKHMYQAYKIVLTAANVIFQMFTVSFQCINLLIKNTLCVNTEQFLVYHQQKGHLECMYSALTR